MKAGLAACVLLAMVLPGCTGTLDDPGTDSVPDPASSSSSSASATSSAPPAPGTNGTSAAGSGSAPAGNPSSASSNSTAPPSNSSAEGPGNSTSNSTNPENGPTNATSNGTTNSTTNSTSNTTSTSGASSNTTTSTSTSSTSTPPSSSSTTSTTQAPQAPADHRWIPPQTPSIRDWGNHSGKDIRPGAEIHSDGGECTANFIFHLDDTRYFIGTAAHCFNSSGDPTYPGCGEWQSYPLNSTATIEADDGSRYAGTLAYSSWLTMRKANESDPDVCRNDFALVEIPASALAQVHPAVLHFGGPTGPPATFNVMRRSDPVYAALSSDYEAGYVFDVNSRAEKGVFDSYDADDWLLLTNWNIAGGSQGDSGGGLLGPNGVALGVLSTGLQVGWFDYSNLWLGLAYMKAKVGWAPSVVTWSTFDATGNYG